MKKSLLPFCVLVLAILFVVSSGHTVAPAENKFLENVAKISAGADSAARRAAIVKRMDEVGVNHRLESFTHEKKTGLNLVGELKGNQTKTIMLTAHYDRVPQGFGAVDNASGVAAVLELLTDFHDNPLKNYKVTAAFFDLEELGLFGSKEYVTAHKKDGLPTIAINFDVFGYGDTLWVMTPNKKAPSAVATKKICDAAKFPLHLGSDYPDSDHESFIAAKVETLGVSLIDGKEITPIYNVIIKGERPATMPRLLTFMHSPGDTVDKIDANAASRAIAILNKCIRAIDGN